MVARTNSRQIVYSNDEFENLRSWPVTTAPFFVRRKRFKFLTPAGWIAVCVVGAVTLGAALALTI
jgi:hypothetical protein